MRWIFLFAFLVVSCINCSSKKDQEQKITVFCAASLAPVIQQMKVLWEQEHESQILINAASSGLLARQIENGAPADLYISADDTWMQYIVDIMELKAKVVSIASNQLVIAAPQRAEIDTLQIEKLTALLTEKGNRMVIGDPAHVPLGKYTRECLDYYDFAEEQKSKYIVAKDARNALRLVELGEASFGILYYSDAISSDDVKILSMIPTSSHQPITYSAIVLNDKKPDSARFLAFITGEASSQIWQRYGFTN